MSLNQIEAIQIKKGTYIIINGRPCKIVQVDIAKTGKHGHMKVSCVGIDLLTGNKLTDMRAGHKQVSTFNPVKNTYQFLMLDDNEMSCLDANLREVKIRVDKESQIYKTILNLSNQLDDEKMLTITTISAPVETSKDNFEDRENIETALMK